MAAEGSAAADAGAVGEEEEQPFDDAAADEALSDDAAPAEELAGDEPLPYEEPDADLSPPAEAPEPAPDERTELRLPDASELGKCMELLIGGELTAEGAEP